jgi:hypothetical protein
MADSFVSRLHCYTTLGDTTPSLHDREPPYRGPAPATVRQLRRRPQLTVCHRRFNDAYQLAPPRSTGYRTLSGRDADQTLSPRRAIAMTVICGARSGPAS